MTEDLFHFTDEALEKCALLDATFWTMETEQETAQREKAKRETVMRMNGRSAAGGKRYQRQGDQTAHRTYPGGASKILISGMAFDKFTFVPPERMMWTRWPQHH